jgi:hypothetical protein
MLQIHSMKRTVIDRNVIESSVPSRQAGQCTLKPSDVRALSIVLVLKVSVVVVGTAVMIAIDMAVGDPSVTTKSILAIDAL